MTRSNMSRRELLETAGKAAAAAVALPPLLERALGVPAALAAQGAPLTAVAGVDRITILGGKTYLNGWTGYGNP
ncbi:MAG: hypothetical protein IMZ55_08625, partial [Acidobacteria bacterium]|nr:hypothetical protein [Acidobacteriota bacterium]